MVKNGLRCENKKNFCKKKEKRKRNRKKIQFLNYNVYQIYLKSLEFLGKRVITFVPHTTIFVLLL